ncbi:MAG: hypothetical protein AABZ36_05660 [Nitrospirota bacterium]
MHMKWFLIVLLALFLLFPACSGSGDKEQQPVVFKQDQEIQGITPENPVKIKLKRSSKNEYSWEISGDNADEVIKTDKRLKEGLKE